MTVILQLLFILSLLCRFRNKFTYLCFGVHKSTVLAVHPYKVTHTHYPEKERKQSKNRVMYKSNNCAV